MYADKNFSNQILNPANSRLLIQRIDTKQISVPRGEGNHCSVEFNILYRVSFCSFIEISFCLPDKVNHRYCL